VAIPWDSKQETQSAISLSEMFLLVSQSASFDLKESELSIKGWNKKNCKAMPKIRPIIKTKTRRFGFELFF